MKLKNLIYKNRSYRRFDENFNIDEKILRNLIDLARMSASSSNKQFLKFIISNTSEKNSLIFPHLAWAGYLTNWPGPKEGERPSAYIIILGNKNLTEAFSCDHGIAAQSILLGAVEKGLGGCMIVSMNKEKIIQSLNIPANYAPLLTIALGKPIEKVVIEPVSDGDIKYWRDEEQGHHVPKRSLDDVILKI